MRNGDWLRIIALFGISTTFFWIARRLKKYEDEALFYEEVALLPTIGYGGIL